MESPMTGIQTKGVRRLALMLYIKKNIDLAEKPQNKNGHSTYVKLLQER